MAGDFMEDQVRTLEKKIMEFKRHHSQTVLYEIYGMISEIEGESNKKIWDRCSCNQVLL